MVFYHHSEAFPNQQEPDRKKRLICKEKNVILLEIWDNWDEDTWIIKIFEQIKTKTGIEIKQEKLNELSKYIGGK